MATSTGDSEADLEVAVGCYDSLSHIAVVDSGQLLSVWDLAPLTDCGTPRSLLLLDLDSNDTLDVVAGTSDGHLFAVDGMTGQTFWQYDLSRLSNTPVSGPVAGDIDWDGHMELVAGGDSIYVFSCSPSCSLLASASLGAALTMVSLGELDESLECLATEIIAGHQDGIAVLRYTSDPSPEITTIYNHDLNSPPAAQAVVGDIYRSVPPRREAFFPCENDTVYILHDEGRHVAVLQGKVSSACVPLMIDLFMDDSRPDLVFISEQATGLVKVEGDGGDLVTEWAMEGNDLRHTGVYAYTLTGTLENDQVWWGRYRIPELQVCDNLVIEPGSRIEVGMRQSDGSTSWWEGALGLCYGYATGGITAHGTEEEPIVFTTAAPSTYPLWSGWDRQWSGIEGIGYSAYYGDGVDLRHCIIEEAAAGCYFFGESCLAYWGPVTMTHCRFSRCGVGLSSANWHVTVDSCEFVENDFGVYGDAYVTNSRFVGNMMGAMSVDGGAIGNTISGNSDSYGMSLYEGYPWCGLIDCDHTAALMEVSGNVVEGCGQAGMTFTSYWDSTFLVQHNAVWDCGIGMHFRREPDWACSTDSRWTAVVTDTNGIIRCSIGVYCDSAAVPFMGDSTNHGNNDIVYSWVKAGINEDDSLDVPAQYNWWGIDCADSESVSQLFDGTFKIEPCLDHPIWAGVPGAEVSDRRPVMTFEGTFPNPLRSVTKIKFSLPVEMHVKVTVYDVLGREVKTVADATLPPGQHAYTWDGTDRDGVPVASGIYFCRIASRDAKATRKMVFIQ